MAASNLKDIKRSVKSVESTMQITKAMELVASSKLRRAKEKAELSRPFFDALYETMSEIITEATGFQSIYTQKQLGNVTLLIVIAGDRGLAGGFNTNVFKLAQTRIAEIEEKDGSVVILAIGKKSVEYFQKRSYKMLGMFESISEEMTPYKAMELSDKILQVFQDGHVSCVEMIFTNYVSPLVQQTRHMPVIPLENIQPEVGYRSLTAYEPSPEAVFDALIPKYISGMLYGAIVDSYAAEQAARRVAMENATDNATDMIDQLSLLYNRARQAAITQEISEIVGGASAQQ